MEVSAVSKGMRVLLESEGNRRLIDRVGDGRFLDVAEGSGDTLAQKVVKDEINSYKRQNNHV